MNPVTLESTLAEFGLGPTEREALTRIAPDADTLAAMRADIDAHLAARPAHRASAQRLAASLADIAHFDFTSQRVSDLAAAFAELNETDPTSICSLCANLGAHLTAAAPDAEAARAASRLMFFLATILLRAANTRQDRDRKLAAASDEATGLYRGDQALAQMSSWIAAGTTRDFALCLLKITMGPVLLRMSASLSRALLRQISARLRRTLRPQDALFSAGEWEWLALMPGLEAEADLQVAGTRLLHIFDLPFDVFGREYRLSAHAAGSLFPGGGRDAETLLRSARIALFEAQRKNLHFDIFRAEMDRSAERYATIEHGFLEALREDRLELYLQPQIDAADGVCRAAEALLRWGHADGHTIAPQFIVEMAFDAGAQHSFSRWLITRAVRTLAEIERRGFSIGISINLTANDLADPELPGLIAQTLALWRVKPSRLTVELTEAAIVPDEHHTQDTLAALRASGIRIAVDDFGTGYSSMAYLRQLPLDELKIDQLFVRRMASSEQDREIVRSMLQLAHGLGLAVVAEGVEDAAAAAMLKEYGCQRLQGFLFAPAMPSNEFLTFLRQPLMAGR